MIEKLTWQCASFDELTGKQIYAILQARCAVFSVEQNCAFLDPDGHDFNTLHLMAWTPENEVAGYLRIHAPNTLYKEPSIGRVLTTADYRGCGLGQQLFKAGLMQLEARYPMHPVRINAQAYLKKFYASFGFEAVSKEYLEDNIPHIEMLRPAS